LAKNKLVKNIDEDIWRKFIAYCVLNNVKVGDELNKVLDKYLKGRMR